MENKIHTGWCPNSNTSLPRVDRKPYGTPQKRKDPVGTYRAISQGGK